MPLIKNAINFNEISRSFSAQTHRKQNLITRTSPSILFREIPRSRIRLCPQRNRKIIDSFIFTFMENTVNFHFSYDERCILNYDEGNYIILLSLPYCCRNIMCSVCFLNASLKRKSAQYKKRCR